MFKIAIAGLGAAARTIHLPALRLLEGVELVGGYDANPAAAPAGIRCFASVAELLERTRPSLLIVATPTVHHHSIAREALLAGVNVLCEKPFATNLDEARDLVALAAQQGLLLAVNNQYRFMRSHAAACRAARSPEFGELLFIHAVQSFSASGAEADSWRYQDPEQTCKEFGTHVFDLCRYLFGAEPVSIRAAMPRPLKESGPDLLNLVDIEFPAQRYARVTLDRLSKGQHRYLDMRLDGTRAAIETRIGGAMSCEFGLNPRTRLPFISLDVTPSARAVLRVGDSVRVLARDPRNLFAAATAELLRQFMAALNSGDTPPCSGADNLRTFAMMRAAYESAATGRTIDLRQPHLIG